MELKQNLQKAKMTKQPWFIIYILLAIILLFIVWQLYMSRPVTIMSQEQPLVDYSATAEINEGLHNLTMNGKKAEILTKDCAPNSKISINFDGMADPEIMQRILELLQKYETTATFYISGIQAAEDPEVVKNIANANHEIGNYTLRAEKHMEEYSKESLVEDFCAASKVLSVLTGDSPTKLKCNVSEYTDPLLEAAYASGLKNAVKSTVFLTYQSFRTYEDTKAYVDKLAYKSIVSVKLIGVLDETEYIPKEVIETPAIDKQPDVPSPSPVSSEELLSKDEKLIRMIEWMLIALKNTNYSPETETLKMMNGGKLAEPVSDIKTVQPAVVYTFYGLNRTGELNGIIEQLKAVDGTGTFFVTAKEIEEYPEQIELLINSGQSIGIAVYPQKDADFYSVCFDLLQAKKLLEEKFRYNKVRSVMQPWGKIESSVKEAASAINCIVVTHDIAVAREENKDAYSAKQIENGIFGENDYGFKRGQVIVFRMNYFERGDLLSEVLELFNQTRNAYPIKDVYMVVNSSEYFYTYPLSKEDILPEVKDKISTGQLKGEVIDLVGKYYIGNPYINTRSSLLGFSGSELGKIDKAGRITNDDKAVFLTFDDWGTDMSITKILNVLKKHKVTATFFIRSKYVEDNPNLLRAIAMDGHEIASHTHNHLPLVNDSAPNGKITSLNELEAGKLKQDIVSSYNTLQGIIGDIKLDNGKPALSRIFRPPTLAVSKIGMEAVFDCGMTYIINGDYTTQDYLAKSAEELFKKLKANIKSGSIVVMHMSENGIHTAEALDMFLTYNEQKEENKQFTFARISDYLN